MHISDVHEYKTAEHDKHSAVTKKFISQGRRKIIQNAIENLVSDEFDRLEDYANEHISDVAAERAERFLERVLNGDNDAAMELLGNHHGSDRYRTGGCDDGKPWANLIHGNLFETSGITLRRKIVEANSDLLKSERIADLESIVEGLSDQVRKLEGL